VVLDEVPWLVEQDPEFEGTDRSGRPGLRRAGRRGGCGLPAVL